MLKCLLSLAGHLRMNEHGMFFVVLFSSINIRYGQQRRKKRKNKRKSKNKIKGYKDAELLQFFVLILFQLAVFIFRWWLLITVGKNRNDQSVLRKRDVSLFWSPFVLN